MHLMHGAGGDSLHHPSQALQHVRHLFQNLALHYCSVLHCTATSPRTFATMSSFATTAW
jgi:hypothetical protein